MRVQCNAGKYYVYRQEGPPPSSGFSRSMISRGALKMCIIQNSVLCTHKEFTNNTKIINNCTFLKCIYNKQGNRADMQQHTGQLGKQII